MDVVSTQAIALMNSQMVTMQANVSAGTDDSFQNIMDQSIRSNTEVSRDTSDVSVSDKEKNVQDSYQKQKVMNSSKDAESNKAISDSSEPVNEQVEENIKETVQNALDLTEEELEAVMSQLGLEYMDLLNSYNMKMLFLEVNNLTDASEILMNEDLFQQFTALMDSMEALAVMISPEHNAIVNDELEQELLQNMETSADDEQGLAHTKNSAAIVVENEGVTREETFSSEEFSDSSNEFNQESMDAFVQNLANAKADLKADVTGMAHNVEIMREIVNQVVEQIKIAIKPESTSMELQLNPESLGKVNLAVVAKDGVLTATFMAQNEIAKTALESQIQILRENLDAQGLKVDAIEVTVAEFGFEQQSQGETGQQAEKGKQSERRILDLGQIDDMQEDLSEEENLAVEVMKQNGGSVDYTV